ncbi:MAG: hypothetical protein ACTSPQ_05635 [Candidatus Helarchaeota archaeon]
MKKKKLLYLLGIDKNKKNILKLILEKLDEIIVQACILTYPEDIHNLDDYLDYASDDIMYNLLGDEIIENLNFSVPFFAILIFLIKSYASEKDLNVYEIPTPSNINVKILKIINLLKKLFDKYDSILILDSIDTIQYLNKYNLDLKGIKLKKRSIYI